MECAFASSRWGTPEHAIPAYAQLHQAALLVVERNYRSTRFWRNGRVVDEIARQSPIAVLVLPKDPASWIGRVRDRTMRAPMPVISIANSRPRLSRLNESDKPSDGAH